MEFKKVIDTGADRPALPCKTPPPAPIIKTNLMAQLTAPVKWSQTIEQMINDGAKSFTEVGPGNVLQGLVRKINRDVNTAAAIFEN